MIVHKTWERYRSRINVGDRQFDYRDLYTGWFLFGVLPLFIRRERNRV